MFGPVFRADDSDSESQLNVNKRVFELVFFVPIIPLPSLKRIGDPIEFRTRSSLKCVSEYLSIFCLFVLSNKNAIEWFFLSFVAQGYAGVAGGF